MNRSTNSHRDAHQFLTLAVVLGLLISLLTASGSAVAQTPTRIIFLHHSCGQNLIDQGGVRPGLTARGYEFWDHGYNEEGLRRADGSHTGANWNVPGDNTDPDGFAAIFGQPLHDPPDNTFSHLMQYDVIAFKSCYPVSNIADDYQLNEYKSHYRAIRDRIDQYPNKIFIVVTQPPQVPGSSTPDEANRARAWTQWLQSDEYLAGHPNVFVFDFFGHLAGADNFLRPEYRQDDYDAHPNAHANQVIGPLFVDFIDQTVRNFSGGGPRPTAAVPTSAPAPPTTAPPGPAPAAGLVEDFEVGLDNWSANTDGTGTTVNLELDTQVAHGGRSSMRVQYTVGAGGWGGCDRYFEPRQDWSAGTGLSLWLRAEPPGQSIVLIVFAGDPNNPTGFETTVQVSANWTQVAIPWTSLVRAEWADASGLAQFDPAQVTSMAFLFAENSQGTLWVDDVGLITGRTQPPAPAATSAPAAQPPTTPPAPGQPSGGGFACPSPGAIILPLLGAMAVLLRRRW